ncbi:MAG TPA: iron-sulfur cluster assembly scaffold protein [Pyrinomonadaceae bacterium]|nr:iron-sulfur cluster assembly scaffold protein [Pyrinomonadaceae bacterium]
MKFYPDQISEKFRAPRHAGRAAGANAVGTEASFVCGAAARFTLRIEKRTKEILEAKYQTSGCGFLIAAAEKLSEKIAGRKLTELHGLDRPELHGQIETDLDKFPAHRSHCLNLCLDAFSAALADFRAALVEEFTGEKALVCTCFGVSEETIERVIKEFSPGTVGEITEICNAGGGCGSCQPLIEDILENARFGGEI